MKHGGALQGGYSSNETDASGEAGDDESSRPGTEESEEELLNMD